MLSDLCYISQGGNSAWSSNEAKPLRACIQSHYSKRQYFGKCSKRKKETSKQASCVCLTVSEAIMSACRLVGFVFIFTAILHFY